MSEGDHSIAQSGGAHHGNIGGAIHGFPHVTSAKAIFEGLGVEGITLSVFDQHSGMIRTGGRPHSFAVGQTKEAFARVVQKCSGRGFNLVFHSFSRALMPNDRLGFSTPLCVYEADDNAAPHFAGRPRNGAPEKQL